MPDPNVLPLKLVDGLTLPEAYREVLRPGALVQALDGRWRRLPRFFYEIDAYRTARDVSLAPDFGLYEFINTDLHESELLQAFPRYVPCAVTLLAAHLSLLRRRVDTYVHIAANGAYRSPAHGHSTPGSIHAWGTAVNIYRIGDDYLEDAATIDHYRALIQEVLPGVRIRPFGHTRGYADDHLHLDLGYTVALPHAAAGETPPDADDAPRHEV